MKRIINCLILVVFYLISNPINGQTPKEVVIIGTTHTVPKIIKNSYRPMLKKAKAYAPDAVFVEIAMPDDSLSWAYLKEGYSPRLRRVYALSDSLKQAADYHYDEAFLNQVLQKDKLAITDDEFKKMRTSFLYLRDYPNYFYHQYIQKHGKTGMKKPSRAENWDLSAPLALHLGHKKLYACDDQQTNDLYMKYWKECEEISKENGNIKKLKKTTFKLVSGMVFPALFGKIGHHANKPKSAERLHAMSSLSYAENSCETCDLATRYWDERNMRIAKNLGTQISNQSFQKNVLVIGAAHIVGVKQELEKQFPDIRVVLFNDL